MLNGRIYRVCLAPLVFALVIAAFSLTARSEPLHATLAPEAFDGSQASAELGRLAARFPDRRPASAGDRRLAAYVAGSLRGLGGAAGGGFMVRVLHTRAQTIDGERTITTVVAEHPGTGDGTPIVVIAHRDAAGPRAQAQLSGTAVLLELARIFAQSETKRTIYLVSSSGGSGGDAGALAFLDSTAGPFDAALVLGDLAGVGKPYVLPFSEGFGSAPVLLTSTVSEAIAEQAGIQPGSPTAVSRLAHLVYPLALGEQGPLQARGTPAVLVQTGGEAEPAASEAVGAARMTGLGKAILSAVYALDEGPLVSDSGEGSVQRGMLVQRKVIPGWAVSLVVGMLLLAPFATLVDGLARMRRRRLPIWRSLAWVLLCGLPFFLAALFALVLGALGVVAAAPHGPIAPAASPLGATAWEAMVAVVLVLALAWLAMPALLRAVKLRLTPPCEGTGVAAMLVLELLAIAVWLANPFAALLPILALHLWIGALSLQRSGYGVLPRPLLAIVMVLGGLIPLALIMAHYALAFGMGPLQLADSVLLMLVGGSLGIAGVLLWSVALGCLCAMLLVALEASPGNEAQGPGSGPFDGRELPPIRGPLTYAGPGSLGGTESALRR